MSAEMTLTEMRARIGVEFSHIEHFDPLASGFGFLVAWRPATAGSASFKAWEVTAFTNEPIIETEHSVVSGNVRSDHCATVFFGDEDGNMHLCEHSYRTLAALIVHLHDEAARRITAAGGTMC